jgi:diguanylate cyclase (GGDEF)-like protein/PAS domain S-box-containing protein
MKNALLSEINDQAVYALLEIISDGIWDWDANSGYVHRSPGWYAMLGYNVNALANNVFTWESVIHPDDFNRVMEHFDRYTSGRSDNYQINYRCLMCSGDYLWVEDKARIVSWNDNGTVARMIGAHRNIDAEIKLAEVVNTDQQSLQTLLNQQSRELIDVNSKLELKVIEAERLATTDSLTMIANRYCFEQKLALECARAQRFNEPLSLISIDIDNFKTINDQNGHATGDLVLVKVSRLISDNIRQIDLAARWGGDELMVLLPNTPLTEAEQVAEKLRKLISVQRVAKDIPLTASFGVVQRVDHEEPMRFTIRADDALYQSKQGGRNQVSANR